MKAEIRGIDGEIYVSDMFKDIVQVTFDTARSYFTGSDGPQTLAEAKSRLAMWMRVFAVCGILDEDLQRLALAITKDVRLFEEAEDFSLKF